ncbi:MAG: hypothetical protein EP330_08340 [Deltaproteobacteria bacterium]|nr:MAG: hypothetical protein EP330_08340 [Deltaproteobacteria bacterium]
MKRYKAIVIGTGAGGGPAAAALAEAWGEGVAMVDAGRHLQAHQLTQIEREMIPKIYAQGGAQATEDGSLSVLQGRVVGGSTLVNDALCFRPPPELEERWKAYGAELGSLDPYVDRVWQDMRVSQIPREMINRSNYLVGLGAARLGWAGERLHHNSVGCVQCGFRHLGCSYTAKQSTNLSYVPRALAAGAALHSETAVHHLERRDGQWHVHSDKEELVAEHVVLCAGIVHTPTILLRSGISAGEGLQFHVQTVAWGDFEDRVDQHAGIPMSYGVMEFSDVYGHTGPGYLIEGVGVQPGSFSVQPQLEGAAHDEVLGRYRHLAGALSLVRSTSRGTVRVVHDRPAIDYPLVAHDLDRLGHFYEKSAELFLAAGARRVLLSHREHGWIDAPMRPDMVQGKFYVYTAHPFGGANRGSTTDAVGRAGENLWVLDASGIPEALGVNPQVTIAALALQGVDRLLAG